jgi:hypothetical protein
MAESGCKIRCRACGYFEDCGDGLTPPPARPAVPRRKTVDATPGRGVIR